MIILIGKVGIDKKFSSKIVIGKEERGNREEREIIFWEVVGNKVR